MPSTIRSWTGNMPITFNLHNIQAYSVNIALRTNQQNILEESKGQFNASYQQNLQSLKWNLNCVCELWIKSIGNTLTDITCMLFLKVYVISTLSKNFDLKVNYALNLIHSFIHRSCILYCHQGKIINELLLCQKSNNFMGFNALIIYRAMQNLQTWSFYCINSTGSKWLTVTISQRITFTIKHPNITQRTRILTDVGYISMQIDIITWCKRMMRSGSSEADPRLISFYEIILDYSFVPPSLNVRSITLKWSRLRIGRNNL